ncbi:UNVERIFIED_CONTAM: hypothetical protein PYX00_007287 [Menopon gallinae]|uniref:Phosphoglycerate mutase n=1 Tax=Menopon gallinae TaxID=328185 RepID=A0AAW2HIC2_9NEOP
MTTHRIIMVRHGESEWNRKNLFCGWYDSDLSEKGEIEAANVGKTLKENMVEIDCAHTSMLTRANRTLQHILREMELEDIPVYKTWRLNERHYGGLTGLNRAETAAKFGETQVHIWRRSFNVPPPPMEKTHPYYNDIVNDPRYAEEPSKAEFPLYESLEMTINRTLPYWNDVIVPQLKEGKTVLIAAHGNSLRGIVKHLDDMSEEMIMQLNLPTGIPFEYLLDEDMNPVTSLKFFGDEDVVRSAMETVATMGKTHKSVS